MRWSVDEAWLHRRSQWRAEFLGNIAFRIVALIASTVALVGCACFGISVDAEDTIEPIWEMRGRHGLGCSLLTIADLDGDGVSEIVAGDVDGEGGRDGRLWVLSGMTGRTIRQFPAENSEDGFGFSMAVLSEGPDGTIVAVGAPGTDTVAGINAGRVVALNVNSGERLWCRDGESPDEWFGFALGVTVAPGPNGEVLIGVGSPGAGKEEEWHRGEVAVLSAKRGERVRVIRKDESEAGFGGSIAGSEDLDGHGMGDWVIGSPRAGKGGDVHAVSSETGEFLWSLGAGERSGVGAWIAACGDVDGDGTRDLVAGAPLARATTGAVIVISAKRGLTLESLPGPEGSRWFGWSVVPFPWDPGFKGGMLLVGAPLSRAGRDDRTGRVYLCSLEPMRVLKALNPPSGTGAFGHSIAICRSDAGRWTVVAGSPGDGVDQTLRGGAILSFTVVP